jgi:putative ABC transport system permease protein
MPGAAALQSADSSTVSVMVYGVDERFWRFHHLEVTGKPAGRDALLSPALARDLGAEPGATLLLRVQRPSDIPFESLHGRKDDAGRTVRATVSEILTASTLGEFSLRPQQGEVRAVFLSLSRLQSDLGLEGRSNTLLVSSKTSGGSAQLAGLVKRAAALDDFGLSVRLLPGRQAVALESSAGLLTDAQSTVALEVINNLRVRAQPVFTYLANSLSSGGREIPYSLVTAMDIPEIAPDPTAVGPPPIILNDWAARELGSGNGSRVTMDYYVWEDPGRLTTRTAEFQVAGVKPIEPLDRDMAPVYPGITESLSLADWDPPFPIDLKSIRSIDEEYWKRYRTTPKAYIHFAIGNSLWRSRYGAATSFRFTPEPGQSIDELERRFGEQLREKLDPAAMGLVVQDVRAQSLQASQGATNFGEYFVYFSFFLVVSALLMAALFFKLSVEQRSREVGLLRAVGYARGMLRRLFLTEGLVLAIAGSLIGLAGAIGYGYLISAALRTWWVDAVGTTAITLHVTPLSLIAGAVGGTVAALLCMAWTLRSLVRVPERRLLAGELTAGDGSPGARHRRTLAIGVACVAASLLLLLASATGMLAKAGAFFASGALLLAGCLCFVQYRLTAPARRVIETAGRDSLVRLGLRNTSWRPARSILSMAVMASAIFILISVDAFRRAENSGSADPHSGAGGYELIVESQVPVVHDPASREGREALGIAGAESTKVEGFRLRPGDDASCLNLYEPQNPRILAPSLNFIAAGRFAFQGSTAATDGERNNPWTLLLRPPSDDAVPVIADANSLTYVLHRKLGEDFVIQVNGRPVRLRFVAALQDSIFQSELLMSADNFMRLFPEQAGYRYFLAETAANGAPAAAREITTALRDFGAAVTPTSSRLAEFHRVENAYLSTFQMLGGLGLLLGTAGLAAVLLRNIFERRRELALLRAMGYRRSHFLLMLIGENALLLGAGMLIGTVCALVAISPVIVERGGRLPVAGLITLLAAITACGFVTSLIGTAAALRSATLAALRSE